MKWTGGYSDDKIHIELLKDKKVNRLVVDKIDNTASYEWAMPKGVKKGKNYTLQISTVARPNDQTESIPFKIKPRTPFIVKALPFVVGGAVYFLTSPGGGELPGGGDALLPGPMKPN